MNNRRTRLRSALAVILTVLVLLPVAVLFGRVWQENSDHRTQTDLEKKGIEYITTLAPLISALSEAQSSALQGDREPPDSLTGAVGRVSAVDANLGAELKTKERWADIQDKIGKLPKVTGGALPLYQAHVEVSDLTLALYAAVRRNSQLNRDPDADISNLQQAVAIDMPTAMVLVGQMGDSASLLQNATGAARDALTIEFGERVLAVQDAVNTLTANLQAAADNTSSATLSGSLVNTLDSFRRGVETMTRGANPGGAPNVATMSTGQTALQNSLNTLSNVVLREMDRLLDERNDSLAYRRAEAIAFGVLAVLLVFAAMVWPMVSRRRDPEPVTGPGDNGRDPAANRPASAAGYGQYDVPPNYGDFDPTRRERSGALR